MGKRARFRMCHSCLWIRETDTPCPKCGSEEYYGALYKKQMLGHRAYSLAVSQQPWYDKKMAAYSLVLRAEIANTTVHTPGRTTKKLLKLKQPTTTEYHGTLSAADD